MTLHSMTGFAVQAGSADGIDWVWEARSVNSRGLDLRLRIPDGLDGLEQALRKAAAARLTRGAVTVSLRTVLSDAASASTLNPDGLTAAIATARLVRDRAEAGGLEMAPVSVTDILSQRGVLDQIAGADRVAAQAGAIGAQVAPLLDALVAARRAEGAALASVLSAQVDAVETAVAQAAQTAAARGARAGEQLRQRVAAVLEASDDRVDEARLAQELALIAVKADVTEEIDRLTAHVAAARALLSQGGPVGRKLDFLMQEFNREANTLCSKAGASDLTAIGLDLKVVIDQMREQAQNVE